MSSFIKQERLLLVAIVAAALGYGFEHAFLSQGRVVALVVSLLLIAAILLASMRVAHHAELQLKKSVTHTAP